MSRVTASSMPGSVTNEPGCPQAFTNMSGDELTVYVGIVVIVVHIPELQIWFALQRLPQAPQFAGSTRRSRQVPLQFVMPGPQTSEHAPSSHTWPMAHAAPQAPQ